MTKRVTAFVVKAALGGMVCAVITSTVYGFWFDSALLRAGYYHCGWYDGATRGAPTIWVSSERFCTQKASVVTPELFDFFDKHQQANTTPSNKQLDDAIQQALKDNLRI